MASFGYEALTVQGKTIKASLEAENLEAARAQLKSQNLTPIKITQQSTMSKDLNLSGIGMKRVKSKDLAVFCRQFVSMIRAGVSIIDALRMLGDSTENKTLKDSLAAVRAQVEMGDTLSNAFAAHPEAFTSLMVNMTAAGEASGNLDISMERMADQFENANKTASMVKKAMIYPIVVVTVAIAVVVVMLIKVIPSYVNMFDSMGTELPGITQFVKNASDGLIKNWYIIVPVTIALIVSIMVFSKTDMGKHFFGKIALKTPIVKNLIIKSACAMTARTLSTLLAAGIQLSDAVEIVANIMTNVYYKEALLHAKDEVMIGQPLSRPMEECGLFPPMSYFMVRIGEETGNSEDMLDRLAGYYEDEVQAATAALMAAMEPMIIIVLAGIVGVLVGACMAPMLTMYDALDSL